MYTHTHIHTEMLHQGHTSRKKHILSHLRISIDFTYSHNFLEILAYIRLSPLLSFMCLTYVTVICLSNGST